MMYEEQIKEIDEIIQGLKKAKAYFESMLEQLKGLCPDPDDQPCPPMPKGE